MAKKSAATKPVEDTNTSPTFPYTIVPNSLRRFLKLVPDKPKPTKVSTVLLKSWDLANSNDRTIIGVLKAINFLTDSGEPTENYLKFMIPSTSGAIMAQQIRAVYPQLFETSHRPDLETDPDLKRLFHIHSGGSTKTFQLQIATFKVLCEYARFDAPTSVVTVNQTTTTTVDSLTPSSLPIGSPLPSIHIDLHIHLPENKSSRDYEAIIQDIAKYIYRQGDQG